LIATVKQGAALLANATSVTCLLLGNERLYIRNHALRAAALAVLYERIFAG